MAQPGRPNQGPIPRRSGPPPRPATAPVTAVAASPAGAGAHQHDSSASDDDDDDDDIVALPPASITILLLQILAAFSHSRRARKTPALFSPARPAAECCSSVWPGSYLLLCQWLWDTLATASDSPSSTVAAFELVPVAGSSKRRWCKRATPLADILRGSFQLPLLTTHRPDTLALDTDLNPWYRFVQAVREEVGRNCAVSVVSSKEVDVAIGPTFRAADREGGGMRVWRVEVLDDVYDFLLPKFPTITPTPRTWRLLNQLANLPTPRSSHLAWSTACSPPSNTPLAIPPPLRHRHTRPPSPPRAARALSLSPAPGDMSDLSDTDDLYEDMSGYTESAATLAARTRFNRFVFLHHVLVASPLYRNRHADILVWDPSRQSVHAHDRLSEWLDECIEAFQAKHSMCGVPFVWFEGKLRRYVLADAKVWSVLRDVYEVDTQENGDEAYWQTLRGQVKADLVVAVVRDQMEGRIEFGRWALEEAFRAAGESRACAGGRVLFHAGDPPGRGVFRELESKKSSLASGRANSSNPRKRRRHSSSPSPSPTTASKRARLDYVGPPRASIARPRQPTPEPRMHPGTASSSSSAAATSVARRRPNVAPVPPASVYIDIPPLLGSRRAVQRAQPPPGEPALALAPLDLMPADPAHYEAFGTGTADIGMRMQVGDAATRFVVRTVQSRVKLARGVDVDGEAVLAAVRGMVVREGEVDMDRVVEEVCRGMRGSGQGSGDEIWE